MAQYEDHSTHTTATTPPRERTSGASIAFIVGGLVVAVGIIAWFLMGGDTGTATAPSATSSESSVTVETPAAPADTGGSASGAASATGDQGAAAVTTDQGSASATTDQPAN